MTTSSSTTTTAVQTDDLLTAIFGKTLLELIQEMGYNQTGAMIVLANKQAQLNQALSQATYHLLNTHVSTSSLEMYLDTVNGRFGLDGNPKLSLQKIGQKWDMSRERIRQVESSILRLLRLPMHQQLYLQTIRSIIG